jgi:hypothetical protein
MGVARIEGGPGRSPARRAGGRAIRQLMTHQPAPAVVSLHPDAEMKLLRSRTRTLMIVVAIMSLVFSGERARRNRKMCLARAEYHRRINEDRWLVLEPALIHGYRMVWNAPDWFQKLIMGHDALYKWHKKMQAEFLRVASRPWEEIPDDTSPPPPQPIRRQEAADPRLPLFPRLFAE